MWVPTTKPTLNLESSLHTTIGWLTEFIGMVAHSTWPPVLPLLPYVQGPGENLVTRAGRRDVDLVAAELLEPRLHVVDTPVEPERRLARSARSAALAAGHFLNRGQFRRFYF